MYQVQWRSRPKQVPLGRLELRVGLMNEDGRKVMRFDFVMDGETPVVCRDHVAILPRNALDHVQRVLGILEAEGEAHVRVKATGDVDNIFSDARHERT